MFSLTASTFLERLRRSDEIAQVPNASNLGTHALRRGMARDIVDAGGSLATLLRAGDGRSASYIRYLREHQIEECAATQLLIDHSDFD